MKSKHELLSRKMQRVLNSMKHLDSLRDLNGQQAEQALGGLKRRVAALQHTLDNPSPDVEHSYLQLCRSSISSAQGYLIKYRAKILPKPCTGLIGIRRQGSSTTGVKRRKADSHAMGAKVIELTDASGGEGPAKAGSQTKRDTFDLLIADLLNASSGVVITPNHQDNTLSTPAAPDRMVQNRREHDTKVHTKLEKPIKYEAHSTLQTTTLTPASGETRIFSSDISLHSIQKDTKKVAKNETDSLQGLRPLAAKPKDLNFSGNQDQLFWDGVLEAAMNCRDDDLWYDPCVDFEEDLLP